jgi:hypothetical protein
MDDERENMKNGEKAVAEYQRQMEFNHTFHHSGSPFLSAYTRLFA